MPYFLDALASLRSHVHFFAQITSESTGILRLSIDTFKIAAIQAYILVTDCFNNVNGSIISTMPTMITALKSFEIPKQFVTFQSNFEQLSIF